MNSNSDAKVETEDEDKEILGGREPRNDKGGGMTLYDISSTHLPLDLINT